MLLIISIAGSSACVNDIGTIISPTYAANAPASKPRPPSSVVNGARSPVKVYPSMKLSQTALTVPLLMPRYASPSKLGSLTEPAVIINILNILSQGPNNDTS